MHLLLPGLRLYLVFGISGQAERAEAPSYSRVPIGLLVAPLRPRLAIISRQIFVIDDGTYINTRIHGSYIRTFERASNCVTSGLLLTEPGQASNSSPSILTRNQVWHTWPKLSSHILALAFGGLFRLSEQVHSWWQEMYPDTSNA
jgi:hypothetical protein